MKSFSVQLNELNEGTTHAALTADLAELLRSVMNTGRAGSLTLKLKIGPASRSTTGTADKVTIVTEVKLELPKPERPSDFYWLTEDGETSRNHPRQHDLELREVSSVPPLTFKKV
jgi:hypothetical protein